MTYTQTETTVDITDRTRTYGRQKTGVGEKSYTIQYAEKWEVV